jgi:hypothetical protein
MYTVVILTLRLNISYSSLSGSLYDRTVPLNASLKVNNIV